MSPLTSSKETSLIHHGACFSVAQEKLHTCGTDCKMGSSDCKRTSFTTGMAPTRKGKGWGEAFAECLCNKSDSDNKSNQSRHVIWEKKKDIGLKLKKSEYKVWNLVDNNVSRAADYL